LEFASGGFVFATTYPRMFLLPSGKVFYTGQGSGTANSNSWIFDPGVLSNLAWTQSAATTSDRSYGSAVLLPLLPPNYNPKIINFGGNGAATTEIIDLSVASPKWNPGASMSTGRIQMNAIILPDGKVLAEGGSLNNESADPAGKCADLYDPATNSFTSAGTASYSRLYHSTALLLPDATVASMGSNPGPRGNYDPAIEIYTPAYLFDANDHLITNRPSITGIAVQGNPTQVIGYNSPFSVTYTSSSPIKSAVLVRPGSSTHAFDMEQRLIGLCGPGQPSCAGSGTLSLTSPPKWQHRSSGLLHAVPARHCRRAFGCEVPSALPIHDSAATRVDHITGLGCNDYRRAIGPGIQHDVIRG
jgi:hypothetical protein